MGKKKIIRAKFSEALLRPRDAALQLQISYPTIKQWIYRRKLRVVKTPGGHYRIPQAEIDRLLYRTRATPRVNAASPTSASADVTSWSAASSTYALVGWSPKSRYRWAVSSLRR